GTLAEHRRHANYLAASAACWVGATGTKALRLTLVNERAGTPTMLNIKLSLLAVVGFAALAVAPASAMPVSNLSQTAQNDVQDARLVCNSRGRCYRTGYRSPSYGRYRSYGGYAPSYGFGPSVGFGGYGYG